MAPQLTATKGCSRAGAVDVQHLGGDLLAGARFPHQQHRRLRFRRCGGAARPPRRSPATGRRADRCRRGEDPKAHAHGRDSRAGEKQRWSRVRSQRRARRLEIEKGDVVALDILRHVRDSASPGKTFAFGYWTIADGDHVSRDSDLMSARSPRDVGLSLRQEEAGSGGTRALARSAGARHAVSAGPTRFQGSSRWRSARAGCTLRRHERPQRARTGGKGSR